MQTAMKMHSTQDYRDLIEFAVGPTGYLPSSGGLGALQVRLARGDSRSPLVNEAVPSAVPGLQPDAWAPTNGASPASARSPAHTRKVGLRGTATLCSLLSGMEC